VGLSWRQTVNKASFRTLVDDPTYEATKGVLEIEDRLFDEALKGVTWVLCKDPERGQETDAPGIWAICTDSYHGVPELVVYYVFDDQSVNLLAVYPAEEMPNYDDIDF